MNIKKLIAGVAASALAVSAMAVTASAAELNNEYSVKQYAEMVNLNDDGTFFTQIQLGHIGKIDSLTIEYTAADGSTGYALVSTGWGANAEVEANGITWDAGFETWDGANVVLPEGVDFKDMILTVTAVIDAASEYAAYNAKYPDTAAETTPSMIVFTFGASSEGSLQRLATFAEEEAPAETEAPADTEAPAETEVSADAEAPAETEAAPATTTAAAGNTNTATADKNNADTGVEGVAVVAGLAIVAAGAIVVAKKRK